MTNQLITPARALDRNGEPQPGAKAYVYLSGTTTAQVVTNAVGTALAWPVAADIDGVFPQMFYAGAAALKAVLTDSADAILPGGIIDPVPVPATSAATVSFAPTAAVPSTNVQAAIQAVSTTNAAMETTVLNMTIAVIAGAGLATGSGSLPNNVTITVPAATNADAVTGTSTSVAMTPASTKRAIKEWGWIQGYTSPPQTITSGALLTLAHGLERSPKQVTLQLTCVVSDNNWQVGDTVMTGINSSTSGTSRSNSVYIDATNVYVRYSDDTTCFVMGNKTTGTLVVATNSKWLLTVGAY